MWLSHITMQDFTKTFALVSMSKSADIRPNQTLNILVCSYITTYSLCLCTQLWRRGAVSNPRLCDHCTLSSGRDNHPFSENQPLLQTVEAQIFSLGNVTSECPHSVTYVPSSIVSLGHIVILIWIVLVSLHVVPVYQWLDSLLEVWKENDFQKLNDQICW